MSLASRVEQRGGKGKALGIHNGRAKMFLAVRMSDIPRVCEHMLDRACIKMHPEARKNLARGGLLGARVYVSVKEGTDDGGALLVDDGSLVFDAIAERGFPRDHTTLLDHVGKDELDALRGAVGLVLCDGKLDVQGQSAVGRGGVVVLLGGDPFYKMSVEDRLYLVIVGDVAKPAVKLNKENDVDFLCAYVLEHTQKGGACRVAFACRNALVNIDTYDVHATFGGILQKSLALGIERYAVHGLLLGGHTGIERGTAQGLIKHTGRVTHGSSFPKEKSKGPRAQFDKPLSLFIRSI